MTQAYQIICGDALARLKELPDASVHACITSPPYFQQRDYRVDGQLGQEETSHEYIKNLVAIFREVRRVLVADGTFWCNLGDCFLEDKQLAGIPWRVAFALQYNGWILRSDIIWHKPNAMPESVLDRPTRAHEYIFLFSKNPVYYYNSAAVLEPYEEYEERYRVSLEEKYRQENGANGQSLARIRNERPNPLGKNRRTVWSIPTVGSDLGHFAPYPDELARLCILAGSPEKGTILDPFCGSSTTGVVALKLQRRFIGIELNPDYCKISETRLNNEVGLLGLML